MSDNAYFDSRLAYDKKRKVLWNTLARTVFQPWISPENTVVELGAGYCDLINSIQARERIAVDMWPRFTDFAQKGVQTYVDSVTQLDFLKDASIDVVLASNLFEHLSQDEFKFCLLALQKKMRVGGKLIVLQPNFKYAFRSYFDDYTHQSIWTLDSLCDFLSAHQFLPTVRLARFLPLSIKSRFPVHSLLIRAYLKSPWKPFAGQMLVVATLK
jgi:hypothetical protein